MQIIETDRDYEVTFQFDKRKVDAVKSIQGAWWQGARKVWHIPRHRQREINFLRQRFKVTSLTPVQNILPEQYDEIPRLPELDVEIPFLKKVPRDYQKKGIAYCRMNERVIIGDQPGLGKTIQAIATICSYGLNADNYFNAGPGLVICPSSVKINWQDEWRDVAGHRAMILDDRIRGTWQQYYRVGMCDTFIVNYASLKKFFVKPGWSKPKGDKFKLNMIPFLDTVNFFKWIIIDESHACKDYTAQQTKLVMGICRDKKIVLELTGTPILNKTKDLLSQLYIIDRLRDIVSHLPRPMDEHGKLKDWSGYQRFIERYCSSEESNNLKELNYRLNKFCFYRREKSEVLKDLPEKMRQVIRCEIANRAEYENAIEEFKIWLRETRDSTDPAVKGRRNAMALIKMGTLKQICAKGKLDAAKEYIDEIIENGQKIVVFIHLHEIAEALKKIYPEAVMVTGRQSAEERDRAVTTFQKCKVCGVKLENHKNRNHEHVLSDTNVMICSSAGGEGITLTAASEVLMIEFPWTFGKCEQYEDRTHRISQANNVRIGYLLGDKTIDEYCYYDIILKKKNISQEVTGATDDVVEEMIDKIFNLFNQK
jgi:SWI/SNF-related matrix-associated actin-dependent regulator 1 of chromatin subfamily A